MKFNGKAIKPYLVKEIVRALTKNESGKNVNRAN
jgi:hypothetical protein